MSTQEHLPELVIALQNKVIELEVELKLENENKRNMYVNLCLQIEDLEKDCKELADVIRGLDPTNPILQHLQQPTVEHDGMKYNPVNLKPYK